MAAGDVLSDRFEHQSNALNALRLVFAGTVVVWHAHLLPARGPLPWPLWQLLEELPVDGFFAVSGFLIARSWTSCQNPVLFLGARAARLLPGLWACLVVTAFVVAPVIALHNGVDGPRLVDQARYVLGNAAIVVTAPDIGGAPSGIPYSVWNLSLWSLWWEGWCYVAVLTLGMSGLLRARVVGGLGVGFWALGLGLTGAGVWTQLPGVFWLSAIPRLGLMFACGALLWLLGSRIAYSRWLAAAAAVLVFVGAFTPNYRLVAAPALAYLCLWLSISLGRVRWLRLRNDLSYGVYLYGAPIQQALLLSGFVGSWVGFTGMSLILLLPAAAASWFLVERPSMRLWRKRFGRTPETTRARDRSHKAGQDAAYVVR